MEYAKVVDWIQLDRYTIHLRAALNKVTLRSMKGRERLDYMSNYHIIKKDSD
jgi:hypothetical protein